ncbi:MAG: hypothetical protein AB1451_16750 [Nitrospirota bacterium]
MARSAPARSSTWWIAVLLALVCSTAPIARAYAAEVAGSFSQGRSRLSVVAGNGYAFNDTYFVLGVGAGYFLADGLSIGLDVEWWTGGDPGITKVSPSAQYILVHPGIPWVTG